MIALLTSAHAFCGFYVGGAGQELYNDATVTVLLREGTKTVLSMQNTYSGPPEGFAMVVPVPEVLGKDDVKTLSPELFAKIDQLAAPRLVEYWERDPCNPRALKGSILLSRVSGAGGGARDGGGVTVEAQFAVGEYDIVILSARDSSGLDRWLRKEGYAIPEGADAALKPYVALGTKFFVAKVDPERVTFKEGRAVLSPLRIAYDSESFSLPVRMGLLNSTGEQDLLVHILAKHQRYEVANLPNVRIPTNLRVTEAVKQDFGAFYDALFRNTIADHEGAVVTEYSWNSGTCDPCPGPTLSATDLASLGTDLLEDASPGDWTLTRLHARYGKGLSEDLVFAKADPLSGGRGTPQADGTIGHGSAPSAVNNFQGRYMILHPWTGEQSCERPSPGTWEGPPSGSTETEVAKGRLETGVTAPTSLAGLLIDPLPESP